MPENKVSSPSSQKVTPERTIFSRLEIVLAEDPSLFVKNSMSKMFDIILKY